jgi:hypothetical protein
MSQFLPSSDTFGAATVDPRTFTTGQSFNVDIILSHYTM